MGRVHTYILRGDRESILNRMQITAPLLLEAIPLTLEEIFIYELGGADYAVRDIVLLIRHWPAAICAATGPFCFCIPPSGWWRCRCSCLRHIAEGASYGTRTVSEVCQGTYSMGVIMAFFYSAVCWPWP